MSLAGALRDQAYAQIARFGVSISIARTVPGTFDPATGTTGTGTTTTAPVSALVSQASAGTIQSFDVRMEAGTLIESNIRALTIPAKGLPFVPGPGDVVAGLEGSTWVVLGCTPTSVMGSDVTYAVTVRR